VQLLATLASYGLLEQFNLLHVFDTVEEAIAAYRADTATVTS
jgi:hypothetical protein